jgi:hypothetical protein
LLFVSNAAAAVEPLRARLRQTGDFRNFPQPIAIDNEFRHHGVMAVIAFGISVFLYGSDANIRMKLTSARTPCRKSARGFQ